VRGTVTPLAPTDPDPTKPKVFLTDRTGTHRDPFLESFSDHAIERFAFEAWKQAFRKDGAVFDTARLGCLEERVRAGMTEEDAADAIHGATLDDYVMGRKNGKKNQRLVVIFGQQEQFEEFRDAGREARLGNGSGLYQDTGNLDAALALAEGGRR